MTTNFETVTEWLTRIDGEVLPRLETIVSDPTAPEDERKYDTALLKLYTAVVQWSRNRGDDEATAKYMGATNITLYYEMNQRRDAAALAGLEKDAAWYSSGGD